MSSKDIDQRNLAVSELATRNAKVAAEVARVTRQDLLEMLNQQAAAINTLAAQVTDLERKYNLLLTQNFNRKSTTAGE